MVASSDPSVVLERVPSDKQLSAADAFALNGLWKQLNDHALMCPPWKLQSDASRATVILFARDMSTGSIIGTATLNTYPVANGSAGIINDVVVGEKYRGQGIGWLLVHELIARAVELGLYKISLTSEEHREGARRLYEKLGFVQMDKYFELRL